MQLEQLKNSSLLKDLDRTERDRLAGLFRKLSLEEGSTVFIEQMPGESLYLIQEGTIRISNMIAEGEERTLVVLGPEDVFGEMTIFDGGPRSTTARIAESAKLLAPGEKDFEQLCETDPRLGMKLMRNIIRLFCQRIRDNKDQYRQMLTWVLARKRKTESAQGD